ncbi:MAG: bifunctional metallophosphatase/5'-nucleotidase [Phocaeicola sp.]
MKRIYSWIAIVCFCTALQAQQTKVTELFIYHTNDLHSRIEPMPETEPNPAYAGNGGMARLAAVASSLRAEEPELMLFDCGDFSQGTPYYNLFKGELEVKLMNEIGYDAITVGNHEFDFGLDNMARIFRLSNCPVVCANYHFEGTAVEGLVLPYTILHRKGVKIGVFGLGTPLEGMVQEKCRQGVRYEDPVEAAQRVARQLKEVEKCDLVICLSHLGFQGSSNSDEALIPQTRNIDVVLGGHSHTYFDTPKFYKNLDGEEVLLQQMGKNGVYLGQVKVTLEKE